MRLRGSIGLICTAAAAALPSPAFAFDARTTVLPSALVLVAAAALAAVIIHRLLRRMAHLEQEQARLEAAFDEERAVLGIGPAALYRWDAATGAESFAPGAPFAALDGQPGFAQLLAAFVPPDAAALERAVARLRTDGAGFSLRAALTDGRVFEAIGQRLIPPSRVPLADLVWFVDRSRLAAAEAARDDAILDRDRLRGTLDSLPLPVWRRRGGDLAIVDCNQAYAAAVDAPADCALAVSRELAAGVVAEGGRALAAKARALGAPQAESHHVVIGGSRRLVEVTEAPLPRSGDIVGSARDLTDVESAQAELARHIAAHAEVLEHIASAIAIYGPDSRLAFFNTAFAELWNLEEDWLVTEPTFDEVLERLRERRRLPEYADFRAFKRERQQMFTSLLKPEEELLHLPDERTLRLVMSPHPFGGLTFVFEDVTDRVALERSYNTLIEVRSETLDNLYEAVAVFGSDGRLKLSNPAYAQIWQLTPEDLQGEPHLSEITEKTRSFFDDDGDWPTLKRRIIARLTAHTPSNTRLERRDGSVLEAATVPLPDGNILLSYLDVTDSTRVEHALRERNEALETAGRLKSEFIANVSYELRTPLNAIIGFAEILTKQYFGELNPRQLDYSQGILDSSNRLLSLINDILDLATIEAGYMQLETEEVDIHALMASVLTLTRERARAQGLKLDFDCPTDIGTIVADERRLKQALFNLISNALKFTPAGGTVALKARRSAGRVALVVADTGVGVPREDQRRIFEKFERGNPQARQSGPGLGLSLVKSFIELHGGHVELESRPGSGTVVTCWLHDTAEPQALLSVGE
jgi:signal transduction histidine kinase